MEAATLIKAYLVVDNITDEIQEEGNSTLAEARAWIKRNCEPGEARVVRAVAEQYGENLQPWSCGATFAEAERNNRNGIYDNWNEF